MRNKICLTAGTILIAAALVCLAVVTVGVVGILVEMPGEGDEWIRRARGLQPWGYACVASFVAAFVILGFARDRRAPT